MGTLEAKQFRNHCLVLQVLEVVSETTAPLLDYETLLQRHPEDGSEYEFTKEEEEKEEEEPVPVARSRARAASPARKAAPPTPKVAPPLASEELAGAYNCMDCGFCRLSGLGGWGENPAGNKTACSMWLAVPFWGRVVQELFL